MDEADRVSVAVDLLWSSYAGPLFIAVLELTVAARTDDELRPTVLALESDVRRDILGFCRELFGPEVARTRPFRDALDLTINLMQGAAFTRQLRDGPGPPRLIGLLKGVMEPLFEEALKATDST